MAITNLETSNRIRHTSPRDMEDASELSSAAGGVADATLGASFANTGSEVVIISATGDTDQVFRVQRNGANSEYVGTSVGDASGNTYDTVTVPLGTVAVIGPFDPNRYGATVTLIDATTASDQGLHKLYVVDTRSRRTAKSTVTR